MPWSETRLLRPTTVALLFVLLHGFLAMGIAYYSSPNLDEPAHLAAGISCWKFRRFDLYRVNPPLVRMIAALPILGDPSLRTDWSSWDTHATKGRPEFEVGFDFVRANGVAAWNQFRLARLPCVILALIGGWICYQWSLALYGPNSALLCLWLWATSPAFLGWDASITSDSLAATASLTASYLYWRWRCEQSWTLAVGAGLALGVALLTKFTLLLLLPVFLVLLMVKPSTKGATETLTTRYLLRTAGQFCLLLLVAFHVVNSVYLYQGSFTQLSKLQFVSSLFTVKSGHSEMSNRFNGTLLGRLPVPLPEDYLRGIDIQRRDFEQKKWSFLRGEQRLGGWWYYYLYCVLIKTPVGTLCLALMLFFLMLGRTHKIDWRNETHVILPMITIFVAVSCETGFSRHSRYILPAIPYALICIGRISKMCVDSTLMIKWLVTILAAVAGIESLAAWPNNASFFNASVGGSRGGSAHLLDSNLDWGQDALHLRNWCQNNPTARPLRIAYFGGYELSESMLGVSFEPLADVRLLDGSRVITSTNMPPGWYAISISYVKGYRHFGIDSPDFSVFARFEPVEMCGNSICIYRVGEQEP